MNTPLDSAGPWLTLAADALEAGAAPITVARALRKSVARRRAATSGRRLPNGFRRLATAATALEAGTPAADVAGSLRSEANHLAYLNRVALTSILGRLA